MRVIRPSGLRFTDSRSSANGGRAQYRSRCSRLRKYLGTSRSRSVIRTLASIENPLFAQPSMSAAAAASGRRASPNQRITRRRTRSVSAARSARVTGRAGRNVGGASQPACSGSGKGRGGHEMRLNTQAHALLCMGSLTSPSSQNSHPIHPQAATRGKSGSVR
jgi:hypothetical protein